MVVGADGALLCIRSPKVESLDGLVTSTIHPWGVLGADASPCGRPLLAALIATRSAPQLAQKLIDAATGEPHWAQNLSCAPGVLPRWAVAPAVLAAAVLAAGAAAFG